jgi:hypothetical protein
MPAHPQENIYQPFSLVNGCSTEHISGQDFFILSFELYGNIALSFRANSVNFLGKKSISPARACFTLSKTGLPSQHSERAGKGDFFP